MATSVQKQILTHCSTAIGALSLPNLTNIYIRTRADVIGVTGNFCMLVPMQEEKIEPSTNASYDVAYGVNVILAKPGTQDVTTDHDELYGWRESIIHAFQDATINTITPSVYRVKCRPAAFLDAGAFRANYDSLVFSMFFHVRRTR